MLLYRAYPFVVVVEDYRKNPSSKTAAGILT